MTSYSVPAFTRFIDDMRTLFAADPAELALWEGIRGLVGKLCADESMRTASKGWEAKKGREYILHQDAEYGFFVGALVREPHHRAGIHDHGATWTIYGVLDGDERTHIYDRVDDGSRPGHAELRLSHEYDAPAGHVDMVPPYVVHCEWGMGERSVAITVRTSNPNSHDQNRFDPETGKTWISQGLTLVPLAV
jgi:predicted metal-dependent enzyme (double-stranded beta helix superfamily)